MCIPDTEVVGILLESDANLIPCLMTPAQCGQPAWCHLMHKLELIGACMFRSRHWTFVAVGHTQIVIFMQHWMNGAGWWILGQGPTWTWPLPPRLCRMYLENLPLSAASTSMICIVRQMTMMAVDLFCSLI